MNLAVRPALLPEEREELVALLDRNLPGFDMGAHFSWRHEGNPAGPGWSWVIYERQSGAIRAMASLFPRPMYWNGKLIRCGQVGEFVVDPGYRSLGPAIMLQKATFQLVDSGILSFCYDCPPHDQGMSTFIRLGMRPTCELTRYALPLRSDQILKKKLGDRAWTKPLITGANLVLNRKRVKHRSDGLEILPLEGNVDQEFTNLDASVSSNGTLRSSRSAEVLNWRFRARSDLDIRVLVARRAGELMAFLAFVLRRERRASVLDLFGRDLELTALPLLAAAIDACRHKKVFCLEAYCSDANPLKAFFEAAGFRAREKAARIVAYEKPNGSSRWLDATVSWPMGHAELEA